MYVINKNIFLTVRKFKNFESTVFYFKFSNLNYLNLIDLNVELRKIYFIIDTVNGMTLMVKLLPIIMEHIILQL